MKNLLTYFFSGLRFEVNTLLLAILLTIPITALSNQDETIKQNRNEISNFFILADAKSQAERWKNFEDKVKRENALARGLYLFENGTYSEYSNFLRTSFRDISESRYEAGLAINRAFVEKMNSQALYRDRVYGWESR